MWDSDLDLTDSENFVIWEELVNPGKYQCTKCGALFDRRISAWSGVRKEGATCSSAWIVVLWARYTVSEIRLG